MSEQEKCLEKHTSIQIPDDEWVCPKCGVGPEGKRGKDGFIIEDGPNLSCNLLHNNDELWCGCCEYRTSGKTLAAQYIKKNNLVTCPHCKGKGLVKR